MTQPQYSILLVDDEQLVHEAVGRFLTRVGYFVGHASDGVVGLQMFSERPWNAVITDRAMARMTGEQLASEIRSISPKTPLVLITGHLMKSTHVELFDAVLLKPFVMNELLTCLNKVLPQPEKT